VLKHLLRDPYCLFDRCAEQDSEGLWVFRRPQSFTV